MERTDARNTDISRDAASILALLEDGIEALELGVGIFDNQLRLIDSNRLFRKFRGYPAGL